LTANSSTDAIPVMFPDYSAKGFTEARKWNATIWQHGKGTPPGFTEVSVDYVLRPDKLDAVCGR
jgi:hypothetical protein